MGREIKRVPLDFDWPIEKVWPGYMFSLCSNMEHFFENAKKNVNYVGIMQK